MQNTALTLFCCRKSCKYYESTENTITKDGVYTTKSDERIPKKWARYILFDDRLKTYEQTIHELL